MELVLLLFAWREVMSGEEEVDSFDDFDLDEDLEAVRLQVCGKRKKLVSIFNIIAIKTYI